MAATPGNIVVPSNATGVDVATNIITQAGVTSNLQKINVSDPTGTDASVTAAGTTGANGVAIQGMAGGVPVPVSGSVSVTGTPNVAVTSLPGSPAQEGTDATGVAVPSGGSGIRGWLSGIYNVALNVGIKVASIPGLFMASTNEQSVTEGGVNRLISTLSSATSANPTYVKATAGRVGRLINTSTNAQTVTITIVDQASGAAGGNTIYSVILGQSQIIDLQIPCNNGIGIYASGAASANIVLTWS